MLRLRSDPSQSYQVPSVEVENSEVGFWKLRRKLDFPKKDGQSFFVHGKIWKRVKLVTSY